MTRDSGEEDLIDGDQQREEPFEQVVTGVEKDDPGTVWVKNQIRHANANASRRLAYALITILTLTFLAHYWTTFWFVHEAKLPITALSDLFDKWLPIITGFTGSAVTYFLTKER
jgi:hypothetical protein